MMDTLLHNFVNRVTISYLITNHLQSSITLCIIHESFSIYNSTSEKTGEIIKRYEKNTKYRLGVKST